MITNLLAFDFDGVIVDSSSAKGETFFKLFSKFGLKCANFSKELHLKFPQKTRVEKIQIIMEKFNLDMSMKQSLIDDFAFLSNTFLNNLKPYSGLDDFLLSARNYNFVIISIAPFEEINFYLHQNDLKKFFLNVYGAPLVKREILLKLKESFDKVYFIGDAISDQEATLNTSINFIGKINGSNPFSEKTITFKDYSELKGKLT